MLLRADAEGRVLSCNATACRWLGVPADGQVLLADLFDEPSRRFVASLAPRGYRGASERHLGLADGRTVVLSGCPHPEARGEYLLSLFDCAELAAVADAQEQQRRADALAQLAGNLARELNDPMSIVQGRLELLLELGGASPAALERHLPIALSHARRISSALQNLRLVGRSRFTHLEPLDLGEVLDGARRILGPRLAGNDVTIDIDPAHLEVGGARGPLEQVVANLIDRAVDFCGVRGKLLVKARRQGDLVGLSVLAGPADLQLVVPPAGDDDLLDDGGLGLSTSTALLEALGGSLRARSTGHRALFEVTLARAPSTRARPRPTEDTLLAVGCSAFSRSLGRLVTREGFEVMAVDSGEAALELLEADSPIDAVVAELLLPGMSGLSLLREVHYRHPRLEGSLALVAARSPGQLPHGVTLLAPPLQRIDLLRGLGRKVRRR